MASGSAMGVIFLDKSEYHLYCQLQCERVKQGLLSNQRQLTKIGNTSLQATLLFLDCHRPPKGVFQTVT